MITVTIKNFSVLADYADYAAVARVARLMAGDEYYAVHDSAGKEMVRITHRGNTYTVVDKGDGCEQN